MLAARDLSALVDLLLIQSSFHVIVLWCGRWYQEKVNNYIIYNDSLLFFIYYQA